MGLGSQGNPLVSILLPTHNRADVLPFAIRSVLAQTVQDFELLIVGDGCTDNTAEIVQSFTDQRIHWFDLPKGPTFGYANRNTILQKARGEIIAYMAHDDLWFSDHLERLLPFFDNENIEIAFSRPLWVIPPALIVPAIYNLNHPPTLRIFLNVANGIPSSCVIHRRNCFSKYGYWDDKLPRNADWIMWKKIIKGGGEKNFAYLSDGTCLHFKANWHTELYDRVHKFYFWRQLFDSNQIPAFLKVDVPNDMTEQMAIWTAMSSETQIWSHKIRDAILLALDVCALQGKLFVDALLEFNKEFDVELQPSFENKYSFFIEHFKKMRMNQNIFNKIQAELNDAQTELQNTQVELGKTQNELKNIKETLTWKLYEYITSVKFIRKVYSAVKMPVKLWRSANK